MASPPVNDQYDVFTIPHCRIKQLVHSCNEKVLKNYRNIAFI